MAGNLCLKMFFLILSLPLLGVVWSRMTSRCSISTSSRGSSQCTIRRTFTLASHWSLSQSVSHWASYDPPPVPRTSLQRRPHILEGERERERETDTHTHWMVRHAAVLTLCKRYTGARHSPLSSPYSLVLGT